MQGEQKDLQDNAMQNQGARCSGSENGSLLEAQAQQHAAEEHAAACQRELAETMSRLLHVHNLHEQVSWAVTFASQ